MPKPAIALLPSPAMRKLPRPLFYVPTLRLTIALKALGV